MLFPPAIKTEVLAVPVHVIDVDEAYAIVEAKTPFAVIVPCVEILPAAVVVAFPLTLKRPVTRWWPEEVALPVITVSPVCVERPRTVRVPCVEILPVAVVVALPPTLKRPETRCAAT